MKIILLTHLYRPEIAEPAPYVEKISQALAAKHQLTVIAYAKRQIKPNNNGRLIIIEKSRPLFWRLLKYTLAAVRASASADLIYAQNGIAATLPAIMAKYLRPRPLLIRFYQDEAWQRAKLAGQKAPTWEEFLSQPRPGLKIKLIFWWQKFALSQARAIIAPSQYTADILTKFYQVPTAKIIANHNPAPALTALPFKAKKIKGQIIAFDLNNALELKNIIQALKMLGKDFTRLNLIVIGQSPASQSAQAYARQLGLGQQVSFLGSVSTAERHYWLKTSQLQIILPAGNCQPDVALPGLQAGLPTIGRAKTGLAEAVIAGQSGFLLAEPTPAAIAEAIKAIIGQPQKGLEMSAASQKLAAAEFSWDSHIKKLADVFQNI